MKRILAQFDGRSAVTLFHLIYQKIQHLIIHFQMKKLSSTGFAATATALGMLHGNLKLVPPDNYILGPTSRLKKLQEDPVRLHIL